MNTRAHHSAVARNSLGFLLAGIAGHLYVLATLPLLTRWLSPSDWGFYVILAQVNTILQFGALSLFSQSLLKFYVEYEGAERARFVGTAFAAVVLMQCAFVASLYWARSFVFPTLYPNLDLPLDPYVGWASLWFLAAPLRMFCLSLIKIQERPRTLLNLNLAYGAVLFPALLFFVQARDGGLRGALQGLVLTEWVCLVLAWLSIAKSVRFVLIGRYLARCARFSGPLLAGTFCFLMMSNLDRWVLSRHVDLETLGAYGIGATIGSSLGIVVTAVMTAVSPRIVSVLWKEGDAAAGALAGAVFADVLIAVGLPFGVLCLSSDWLVRLAGGTATSWHIADAALVGIAAGHLVRSIYLSAQNVLFYKGRTVLLFVNNLLLLIIALAIAPLLVRLGGAAGISWLVAGAYVLLAPMTFVVSRRLLPLPIQLRSVALPGLGIVAALTASIVAWKLQWNHTQPAWWIVHAVGAIAFVTACTPRALQAVGALRGNSSVGFAGRSSK